MGFGLMFVGYFVAYVMSYAFIPKLIGCLIMLWGIINLSQYELKFKRCIPVLGVMSVISIYVLMSNIFGYFDITSVFFSDSVISVVTAVDEAVNFIFHAFLLIAITSISKATDLEKLAFKAMRNLLIVGAAEIAYLIFSALPQNESTRPVYLIAFCLRLIWIILDLILLASCYRLICDEKEVDMPDKEINIPVIKQMEEIMRKRDKNAFDSAIRWSEKRRDKRNEKQKRKTKK